MARSHTGGQELRRLAIYYGYPSMVNHSRNLEMAVDTFLGFDDIILGAGLELGNHADHSRSVYIISRLCSSRRNVYGYVNLGCPPRHESQEVICRIDAWSESGVSGIFFDCVGPSYLDQTEVYEAASQARDRGLSLFLNAERLVWASDAAGISENDSLLVEPIFFDQGNPYSYPFPDELSWAVDHARVFGVSTYGPSAEGEAKAGLFKLARNKAVDARLAGLAFTGPHYSASGPDANKLNWRR